MAKLTICRDACQTGGCRGKVAYDSKARLFQIIYNCGSVSEEDKEDRNGRQEYQNLMKRQSPVRRLI